MENIFKVNQRRPTFFFFIPVNAAIANRQNDQGKAITGRSRLAN